MMLSWLHLVLRIPSLNVLYIMLGAVLSASTNPVEFYDVSSNDTVLDPVKLTNYSDLLQSQLNTKDNLNIIKTTTERQSSHFYSNDQDLVKNYLRNVNYQDFKGNISILLDNHSNESINDEKLRMMGSNNRTVGIYSSEDFDISITPSKHEILLNKLNSSHSYNPYLNSSIFAEDKKPYSNYNKNPIKTNKNKTSFESKNNQQTFFDETKKKESSYRQSNNTTAESNLLSDHLVSSADAVPLMSDGPEDTFVELKNRQISSHILIRENEDLNKDYQLDSNDTLNSGIVNETLLVRNETNLSSYNENLKKTISNPNLAFDIALICGIAVGIIVLLSVVGGASFVWYRHRYWNKPQTLSDKCSNADSSGYIDDNTLRDNSEEMYSLDNDSFLNSLEAMTIQNYWTDNVKHTKL